MEVDLQKKIQDYHTKQIMLFGGKIEIEVSLAENGKAYITNIKGEKGFRLKDSVNDWISGYLVGNVIFDTIEDLGKHYGKEIKEYKDLEEIFRLANNCKRAGIDVNQVLDYQRNHPFMSIEDVIIYFNPYCYYNITGDFIVMPFPEEE